MLFYVILAMCMQSCGVPAHVMVFATEGRVIVTPATNVCMPGVWKLRARLSKNAGGREYSNLASSQWKSMPLAKHSQ